MSCEQEGGRRSSRGSLRARRSSQSRVRSASRRVFSPGFSTNAATAMLWWFRHGEGRAVASHSTVSQPLPPLWRRRPSRYWTRRCSKVMTEVDDTRLWSSRMTRNPKCQLSATGGSHRGVVADVDGGPQSEELSRVLTLQETAEWLRVPPRQLGLLRVPCLDFGH